MSSTQPASASRSHRAPRASRSACRTSLPRGPSSRRRVSSSMAKRATRASATWRSSGIPTATCCCSTGGTRREGRAGRLRHDSDTRRRAGGRVLPRRARDSREPVQGRRGRDAERDALVLEPGGAGDRVSAERGRFCHPRRRRRRGARGARGGGSGPRTGPTETMLELDVAGLATISEAGVEVERAPEGVTFAPLSKEHERLYSLVAWDEKFAAHNAALWEHGLLVVVPKHVELAKPLYVRVTNSAEEGSLFWRLLVVAEEGARFTLVEDVSSASPDLHAYTNLAAELFVEQSAKLEYVSLQNLSRETWHFASHHARVERDAELDWVAGGFGSKKGKVRI